MSHIQTLEQERANFAWTKLQELSQANLDQKAFKNLAKAAPALVMNNGLMQALAFYQSRKEKAPQHLVCLIFKWLAQQKILTMADGSFKAGMEGLHRTDSLNYLRATEEALEILRWIRQFADALID
jgi:CRISPR-associated protein Cmr5